MSTRRIVLPLLCGGWIVGGFGVLAVFALSFRPQPGLRGLDAYPSAFIGDPLLLPLVGVILAIGLLAIAPGRHDRWWAAGGGLVGLVGGVTTQVLWLADDHAANWTIPRPHHFNAAGAWHAVYLSLTSALLASLATVMLVRLRHTARRSRQEAARVVGSPLAAVVWIALLSYVALLAHDSGAATLASRTTLSALGVSTVALVLFIMLMVGRLTLAMSRPIVHGLLAGVAIAVLAYGLQGGHGQAFAVGIAVNITVAAALVMYTPSTNSAPSPGALVWSILSGTVAAFLLCALWIMANRARTDRHLVPLAALAIAEMATLAVCLTLTRTPRRRVETSATVVALSAMVWIAGPLVWATEWIRVEHRDVLVGILLALVVYWLLYPVVTARYDEQIQAEAKLGGAGPLPATVRYATAAALGLVVLGLVATALALLSQTLQALASTDFRNGYGWPYKPLISLAVVGGLVALCATAFRYLLREHRLRWLRFVPPLMLLPWCVTLIWTADLGMLHRSHLISAVLVLTSALCGWWASNSLLDNVYLLRLRRVDVPGWLLVSLGGLTTGLSAYWAGSVALVDGEHAWATLPALLGALGVLAMVGLLTTLAGLAAAPPAPTVTLYGLAHNLTQDAIVIAVLHTFAVVLPVIFLVHATAGVDSAGLLTTLAVCAPLLTLLACGYRWTAKNNTSHVRRELHAKAANPAAVEALILREARPWQRLRVQWVAARQGLPGPRHDRFLRVLAAHAYTQNFIGVLLLVPLIVGALALIQERSSGVKVPWRD